MASSKPATVSVLVEYGYQAVQDDELTLKAGDIITDVEQMDGGWWKGTLGGRSGVFPDNFVKVIEKTKAPPNGPQGNNTSNSVRPPADPNGPKPGNNPSNRPQVQSGREVKKKQRARVAYSYEPEKGDELALNVGEIVEITNQVEEGWWEGKLDGKKGLFPSNFVELISDEKGEEDFKEIKGKKVMGVGFGNIFQGNMIKLKSRQASTDADVATSPPIVTKAEARLATSKQTEAPPKAPREPPPAVKHDMDDIISYYSGASQADMRPASKSWYGPKSDFDEENFKAVYDPWAQPTSSANNFTWFKEEFNGADDNSGWYTEPTFGGQSSNSGYLALDKQLFPDSKEFGMTETQPSELLPGNQGQEMKDWSLVCNSPVSDQSREFSELCSWSIRETDRSPEEENTSSEVPLELSNLSYARETPPPRMTFKKRRAQGASSSTPKVITPSQDPPAAQTTTPSGEVSPGEISPFNDSSPVGEGPEKDTIVEELKASSMSGGGDVFLSDLSMCILPSATAVVMDSIPEEVGIATDTGVNKISSDSKNDKNECWNVDECRNNQGNGDSINCEVVDGNQLCTKVVETSGDTCERNSIGCNRSCNSEDMGHRRVSFNLVKEVIDDVYNKDYSEEAESEVVSVETRPVDGSPWQSHTPLASSTVLYGDTVETPKENIHGSGHFSEKLTDSVKLTRSRLNHDEDTTSPLLTSYLKKEYAVQSRCLEGAGDAYRYNVYNEEYTLADLLATNSTGFDDLAGKHMSLNSGGFGDASNAESCDLEEVDVIFPKQKKTKKKSSFRDFAKRIQRTLSLPRRRHSATVSPVPPAVYRSVEGDSSGDIVDESASGYQEQLYMTSIETPSMTFLDNFTTPVSDEALTYEKIKAKILGIDDTDVVEGEVISREVEQNSRVSQSSQEDQKSENVGAEITKNVLSLDLGKQEIQPANCSVNSCVVGTKPRHNSTDLSLTGSIFDMNQVASVSLNYGTKNNDEESYFDHLKRKGLMPSNVSALLKKYGIDTPKKHVKLDVEEFHSDITKSDVDKQEKDTQVKLKEVDPVDNGEKMKNINKSVFLDYSICSIETEMPTNSELQLEADNNESMTTMQKKRSSKFGLFRRSKQGSKSETKPSKAMKRSSLNPFWLWKNKKQKNGDMGRDMEAEVRQRTPKKPTLFRKMSDAFQRKRERLAVLKSVEISRNVTPSVDSSPDKHLDMTYSVRHGSEEQDNEKNDKLDCSRAESEVRDNIQNNCHPCPEDSTGENSDMQKPNTDTKELCTIQNIVDNIYFGDVGDNSNNNNNDSEVSWRSDEGQDIEYDALMLSGQKSNYSTFRPSDPFSNFRNSPFRQPCNVIHEQEYVITPVTQQAVPESDYTQSLLGHAYGGVCSSTPSKKATTDWSQFYDEIVGSCDSASPYEAVADVTAMSTPPPSPVETDLNEFQMNTADGKMPQGYCNDGTGDWKLHQQQAVCNSQEDLTKVSPLNRSQQSQEESYVESSSRQGLEEESFLSSKLEGITINQGGQSRRLNFKVDYPAGVSGETSGMRMKQQDVCGYYTSYDERFESVSDHSSLGSSPMSQCSTEPPQLFHVSPDQESSPYCGQGTAAYQDTLAAIRNYFDEMDVSESSYVSATDDSAVEGAGCWRSSDGEIVLNTPSTSSGNYRFNETYDAGGRLPSEQAAACGNTPDVLVVVRSAETSLSEATNSLIYDESFNISDTELEHLDNEIQLLEHEIEKLENEIPDLYDQVMKKEGKISSRQEVESEGSVENDFSGTVDKKNKTDCSDSNANSCVEDKVTQVHSELKFERLFRRPPTGLYFEELNDVHSINATGDNNCLTGPQTAEIKCNSEEGYFSKVRISKSDADISVNAEGGIGKNRACGEGVILKKNNKTSVSVHNDSFGSFIRFDSSPGEEFGRRASLSTSCPIMTACTDEQTTSPQKMDGNSFSSEIQNVKAELTVLLSSLPRQKVDSSIKMKVEEEKAEISNEATDVDLSSQQESIKTCGPPEPSAEKAALWLKPTSKKNKLSVSLPDMSSPRQSDSSLFEDVSISMSSSTNEIEKPRNVEGSSVSDLEWCDDFDFLKCDLNSPLWPGSGLNFRPRSGSRHSFNSQGSRPSFNSPGSKQGFDSPGSRHSFNSSGSGYSFNSADFKHRSRISPKQNKSKVNEKKSPRSPGKIEQLKAFGFERQSRSKGSSSKGERLLNRSNPSSPCTGFGTFQQLMANVSRNSLQYYSITNDNLSSSEEEQQQNGEMGSTAM